MTAVARGIDTTGWTLADFREAYASGRSVMEVIEVVLDALDALAADDPAVLIGPPLRAEAMAAAARLDADESLRRLPLFGVPVLVKDNIDVAGVGTTAASPSFAYIAAHDATAVARLRAAGAVIAGKTNLDQFATGLVGTRSPYGTPRNALDEEVVPGGSSSGSAIAVARGVVPIALGTDTAGSGRVPAALNHVVGLKPTIGRLPSRGVVPAVRRSDCVSVFALTVDDAAEVAAAMEGDDGATTRQSAWRPGPSARPRIGVPSDLASLLPDDSASATDLALAIDLLRSVGAEALPIEVVPFLRAGEWLYGGPLVAERAAAVGDFLRDGDTALDPNVVSIIKAGTAWSAVDAYLTEYRLAEMRRSFVDACRDLDAVVLPAIARTVRLAEVDAEPVAANTGLGTFTTFTNLLDACAVVVPLGVDGRPDHRRGRAVQLVAPAWGDRVIATLGSRLAAAAGATLGATGRAALEPSPPSSWPTSATSGCTLVVVGAHLRGQPLEHQLTDREGRFIAAATTAPCYRLHALATTPPKPGLVRTATGGAAIEVEVWALTEQALGSFLSEVPAPLCIGTIELADGSLHKGFLVEPWALAGAPDITDFGGWRAFLAGERAASSAP
jgi:allophanate hydrolase